MRLARHPMRGIASENRIPLDHFDAIVSYAPVLPGAAS
jgi:hypothetical protein